MARVRITPANVEAKITAWAPSNSTTRVDDLVFYDGEITPITWIDKAWQLGNMIIKVSDDVAPGFKKLNFVEKLNGV